MVFVLVDFDVDMIGVFEDFLFEFDFCLELVGEGVFVVGIVEVILEGECFCCLDFIKEEFFFDV